VNLVTCGSIWCCPLCAEKILAGRVDELLSAIDNWTAQGGRVAMVTLTMRHRVGQALSELWGRLSKAWGAASGDYRSSRDALADVDGWVRRVEATHGRNGWHLHVHALLFLRGETTEEAARSMGEAMFAAWSKRLQRDGLDAPVRHQGGLDVKLLELDQAREHVAGYLAKGTYEASSAALELAGGMAKGGRRGNRSPFEVLRDLVANGEARDLAIWREWEQASKGRRAITWRQGFRAQLLAEVEQTDEELAEDGRDEGSIVAWIEPGDWESIRDRWAAQLLTVVEHSDVDDAYDRLARWFARRGLSPPLRA